MYVIHAADEAGQPIDLLIQAPVIDPAVREQIAAAGWTVRDETPVRAVTLTHLAVRYPVKDAA